jgi:hypothetical protein
VGGGALSLTQVRERVGEREDGINPQKKAPLVRRGFGGGRFGEEIVFGSSLPSPSIYTGHAP